MGDGETQLFERRDKEIIYAFEICTKLYYLLQSAQKTSNSKIITSLESGYNKYTKEKRNVFDKLKKRHVFEKLSSP